MCQRCNRGRIINNQRLEQKRKEENQQVQERAKDFEEEKQLKLKDVLQKQKFFNKTFSKCICFYATSLVEELKMNAYMLNIIWEMSICAAKKIEFTGHEHKCLDNNGIKRYVPLIIAKEYAPRRDIATVNEIYYYHIRDTKTEGRIKSGLEEF